MAHAQQDSSAPESGRAPDLEAGIADIFARLREADEGGAERTAPAATPVDDGATFDLLGELDRLWRDGA